ncbi:MAG: helix-turn-helix transcriptional regulator [Lachnospiraceae bacterium]|nr:helix-turn-helix transcriptional regulator [Lachnospiraceae bacterium]MCD7833597.1 helix-turn-helix transcriptional regulator [Lachnospiraceae bacterium]MCD8075967.1 helix-turn-helix transcriptional regulator [Lachnospiraceae bacterium]
MSEKRKKQYRQLGLTIAYYRKMNGMTQMQLAEAINVSRTHLSNIEAPNMPTSVSLELLFDISDVLEIPIAKLFEFRE